MREFYLVLPEDTDMDVLIMDLVDPNAESRPDVYLDKSLAEEDLKNKQDYGLKYTLKTLKIAID